MENSTNNTPPPLNSFVNASSLRVLAQVGCLTPTVIFAALLVGLWLDRTLETLPLFTLLLLIGSAPLTFIAVWMVVQRSKDEILASSKPKSHSTKPYQEEARSDDQ